MEICSKESLLKVEIWDIMQTGKMKTAAKKIIRFYCRKKAQMTRNYFPSDEDNEEDTRRENVRREFAQIVDSIKGKFSHVKNEEQ